MGEEGEEERKRGGGGGELYTPPRRWAEYMNTVCLLGHYGERRGVRGAESSHTTVAFKGDKYIPCTIY